MGFYTNQDLWSRLICIRHWIYQQQCITDKFTYANLFDRLVETIQHYIHIVATEKMCRWFGRALLFSLNIVSVTCKLLRFEKSAKIELYWYRWFLDPCKSKPNCMVTVVESRYIFNSVYHGKNGSCWQIVNSETWNISLRIIS